MRLLPSLTSTVIGLAFLAACSTASTQTPPPAAPAPAAAASVPNMGALTGVAKTTLPSGVVFESVQTGSGPSPKPTDMVKVNYRGMLTNGTEFDSSYKRGQPASFPLNRVIPCWTEAVQLMKPGGKARITCPAYMAYAERGVPGVIPPNSTLVFDIELLSIGS